MVLLLERISDRWLRTAAEERERLAAMTSRLISGLFPMMLLSAQDCEDAEPPGCPIRSGVTPCVGSRCFGEGGGEGLWSFLGDTQRRGSNCGKEL